MVVNDNACLLAKHRALGSIAGTQPGASSRLFGPGIYSPVPANPATISSITARTLAVCRKSAWVTSQMS
jgi:hypothetical protein